MKPRTLFDTPGARGGKVKAPPRPLEPQHKCEAEGCTALAYQGFRAPGWGALKGRAPYRWFCAEHVGRAHE